MRLAALASQPHLESKVDPKVLTPRHYELPTHVAAEQDLSGRKTCMKRELLWGWVSYPCTGPWACNRAVSLLLQDPWPLPPMVSVVHLVLRFQLCHPKRC